MKNKFIQTLQFAIIAIITFTLASCSKEKSVPANVTASQEDYMSTDLLPGEIVADQVNPGVYVIMRFIDTGDDETAQFNGYTFQFQADGDLIATTNRGRVFTGRWSVNSAETRMNIVIGGNEALEDLDDDDWRINRLTNSRIRISAPDPDIVVFVRQ